MKNTNKPIGLLTLSVKKLQERASAEPMISDLTPW